MIIWVFDWGLTRIILYHSQSSLSCGSSNLAGAGSILSPLIEAPPLINRSSTLIFMLLQKSPFSFHVTFATPHSPSLYFSLVTKVKKNVLIHLLILPHNLSLSVSLMPTFSYPPPPHCPHNLKLIVGSISQFVPPWFFRHNLKPSPNLIGEDPHCQAQQVCNDDDPPPPLHPDQFCPRSSEQAFFCAPSNPPVIAPAS